MPHDTTAPSTKSIHLIPWISSKAKCPDPKYGCIRAPMHPGSLRCSSVSYPSDMGPRRALRAGRLGVLGATPYFRTWALGLTFLRPLPRRVTRALSFLVVIAWIAQMGLLARRNLQASSMTLGGDLARYGSSAQWKGVYSRGEKIGFLVGQTIPRDDGYELQEDGQLQMTLLGASTAARLHTSAIVDREFQLKSFHFSLDPGTGTISVRGRV